MTFTDDIPVQSDRRTPNDPWGMLTDDERAWIALNGRGITASPSRIATTWDWRIDTLDDRLPNWMRVSMFSGLPAPDGNYMWDGSEYRYRTNERVVTFRTERVSLSRVYIYVGDNRVGMYRTTEFEEDLPNPSRVSADLYIDNNVLSLASGYYRERVNPFQHSRDFWTMGAKWAEANHKCFVCGTRSTPRRSNGAMVHLACEERWISQAGYSAGINVEVYKPKIGFWIGNSPTKFPTYKTGHYGIVAASCLYRSYLYVIPDDSQRYDPVLISDMLDIQTFEQLQRAADAFAASPLYRSVRINPRRSFYNELLTLWRESGNVGALY